MPPLSDTLGQMSDGECALKTRFFLFGKSLFFVFVRPVLHESTSLICSSRLELSQKGEPISGQTG